jgi:hypothetical protein
MKKKQKIIEQLAGEEALQRLTTRVVRIAKERGMTWGEVKADLKRIYREETAKAEARKKVKQQKKKKPEDTK